MAKIRMAIRGSVTHSSARTDILESSKSGLSKETISQIFTLEKKVHQILRANFEQMVAFAIRTSEEADRASGLKSDSCRTAAYRDTLEAIKQGERIVIH